jgi:hypothetical protein
MRQFLQYLTALRQLFRKQTDNIRWLVAGPYADRPAAVFRQIDQTRRDDSSVQPHRGQFKPPLEIAPSPEDLIEHVLQDMELRGLELENFTVRDVRSMVFQQLPNYDFYEGAPPTIELIDRIVTEYLGVEKISRADSCSRAQEIPQSQNTKASGWRTVRSLPFYS